MKSLASIRELKDRRIQVTGQDGATIAFTEGDWWRFVDWLDERELCPPGSNVFQSQTTRDAEGE